MTVYIKRIVFGFSIVVLAACASAPKSTLMPDDVPVLYEAPETLGLVSTVLCEELQTEFDMLNVGIGEDPVEVPVEQRRTIEQRLQKRARSLIKSELNRQLGGAMDVVDFFTDKKETERLRAEGKKRGMIRRAYVMGFMDASACNQGQEQDIELLVAGAETRAEELPLEVMEAVMLSDTYLIEAETELAPAAYIQNNESKTKGVSFTLAVDYVLADQTTASDFRSRSTYLPAPDDVGEDGLWPPKEALVYLENDWLVREKSKQIPHPDDVDEDGLWPPKHALMHLESRSSKSTNRKYLPHPDDVDEDGMWPPKDALRYEP